MVDPTHEDTIECTEESHFRRMAMAMAMATGTSFLFLLNCLVFLDTWDWMVNPPSGFRDAQSGLALLRPIAFGLFLTLPCFLITLNLARKHRAAGHQEAGGRDESKWTMAILCGIPAALGSITAIVAAIIAL